MKFKVIVLIFLAISLSIAQKNIRSSLIPQNSLTLRYPTITYYDNVEDNNPKFKKQWYPTDCCPNPKFPDQKYFLKQYQHIYQAYKKYRTIEYCPCTHFIFGIDKSGSMGWNNNATWNIAKSSLDFLVGLLKTFNDNTPALQPYTYFFSLFQFDYIAKIPAYVHIHPFNTPTLPSDVLGPPGGGTNLNAAIFRAIDLIKGYEDHNTCVIFITDGITTMNYPNPLLDFFNVINKVLDNGCWTCRMCFYLQRFNLNQYQQAERRVFKESCKKMEAIYTQANIQTYKKVFSDQIYRLAKNLNISQ